VGTREGNREERRSAQRHRVSVPVETETGAGVTRDLSLSGLYLVTEQRLVPGDSLRLRISLPDDGGTLPFLFTCEGRVTRVDDLGESVGAGVAFDQRMLGLEWAS
jgi:hypothetical protein